MKLPELPVGPLVDPKPAGFSPDGRKLFGRWVTLAPTRAETHAYDLWQGFKDSDPEGRIWTYLGYGPWRSYQPFRDWVAGREPSRDPFWYSIVLRSTGKAAGVAALMRITPEHGVIEIGHIWFTPALQRSREATEALFLLMRHAFEDLGHRRLEWKCDALNAGSRRSAKRLGFTFEGIFRQHMIVKGRNRDTAWFAITSDEWPAIRERFREWLADDNFDAAGRQKRPLRAAMSDVI